MKKLMLVMTLAGISSVAMAAGGPKDAVPASVQKMSFEKLDVNHDGYVSRSEADADAVIKAGFDAADRSADGRLDAEEFAAIGK